MWSWDVTVGESSICCNFFFFLPCVNEGTTLTAKYKGNFPQALAWLPLKFESTTPFLSPLNIALNKTQMLQLFSLTADLICNNIVHLSFAPIIVEREHREVADDDLEKCYVQCHHWLQPPISL